MPHLYVQEAPQANLICDVQYGTIVNEQGKAILESQIDPEEGENKPYVSNANGARLLQRYPPQRHGSRLCARLAALPVSIMDRMHVVCTESV